MQKVEKNTKCKKCGCADINFIYKPKGYQFSQYQLPDGYNENDLDKWLCLKDEKIFKYCERCKFSWLEDTLDKI